MGKMSMFGPGGAGSGWSATGTGARLPATSATRAILQSTSAGREARVHAAPKGVAHQVEVDLAPSVGVQMRCTRCLISYDAVRASAAACPLCDAQKRMSALQEAVMSEKRRGDLLAEQLRRYRTEVDTTEAMRSALSLLSQDDLIFLKAALYHWRQDKHTQLRVTHGPLGGPGAPERGRKNAPPRANGFLLIPAHAEPEAHLCSSMGGVALAQYLDEVGRATSSNNALAMLMRVMLANLAINDQQGQHEQQGRAS